MTAAWTPWTGGKCPVSKDAVVEIWMRDDLTEEDALNADPVPAGDLRWSHKKSRTYAGLGDIIAYRVRV